MKKLAMKQFTYTVFILFILSFIACKESNEKTQNDEKEETDSSIKITQAQFEQLGMRLGSISKKPFPEVIKATGVIDVPPQNRAVISPIMGGFLKRNDLLIGDKVKKGQALVSVENPEYINLQKEFLEINGQLNYLKSEYERQKKLNEENISSEKKFLKAESDYLSAKSTHSALQKQLELINISIEETKKGNLSSTVNIYSPIKGSITKVNAIKGSFINPTDEIMEIIDNNHIHLELSVFEKDILKLKKGQLIEFKIPESSDDTFLGAIHLIGPSIDENRTVKVHGHIEDEEKSRFLTGMFIDARIMVHSSQEKHMVLPEESIVEVDNQNLIMILKERNSNGYSFETIAVEKGRTQDGFTEIINVNLPEDSQILIRGAFNLIEG